jgi:hypothetical protein
MAITEFTTGHTIPIRNHLISSKVYLTQYKTLENFEKRMGSLPFFSPADAPERKERGPRRDDSGGGARSK